MILTERQFKTAFLSIGGVGRATLGRMQKVLAQHQINEIDFWSKPSPSLCLEAKLTERQQQNLFTFCHQYQPNDYWQWLQQRQIQVVFETDQNYPELLRPLDDKPPILFVKGLLPDTISLPVAVVGSRHVTGYGQMVTEKIVKELAGFHATIVSGLMYGVDSLAHETALKAGTATIGVLGYGFDYYYPASHQPFIDSFMKRGGICITELAPHIKADPYNFPARNRIVAGMSWGVLVTEAGLESGSHITATKAADYGRNVFAVPGSIYNPYSEGTKKLINDGAALVSSGQEIIDILASKIDRVTTVPPNSTHSPTCIDLTFNNSFEEKIYQLLSVDSYTTDDLVSQLNMPIADLVATLSVLEIRGAIKQVGDVWLVK